MQTINVRVTENEVTITNRAEVITSGNINNVKCIFDIDEAFSGLIIRASFNGVYTLVEDDECYAPILDKGVCKLAVYGCQLDGTEYEIVKSPTPTKFLVKEGSFNADDVATSDIPSSEVEIIETKLNKKLEKTNIKAGENITVTTSDNDVTINSSGTSYTAGDNITINDGVISATDTTYTAGTNVSISNENVISATDTKYTAGTNVSISSGNVISATDTTYTAGNNITIQNGVISASGGASIFVATYTTENSDLVCDKTYAQIKSAYDNGEVVQAEFSGVVLNLVNCDNTKVDFSAPFSFSGTGGIYTISHDNSNSISLDYYESVEVVQSTGSSTESVMSQKAVSDELSGKQNIVEVIRLI